MLRLCLLWVNVKLIENLNTVLVGSERKNFTGVCSEVAKQILKFVVSEK